MRGLTEKAMKKSSITRFFSIRNRIIIMMLSSILLSVIIFTFFTCENIASKLNSSINKTYLMRLHTIGDKIDEAYNEMNLVSSGLVYKGGITSQISDYLNSENIFQRNQYRSNIISQIILNDFSSSIIGFIAFFEPDNSNQVLFSSEYQSVLNLDGLVNLYYYAPYTVYHAPHISITDKNEGIVISLIRTVESIGEENISLYIETDAEFIPSLFDTLKQLSSKKGEILYCLTNKSNEVIYTSNIALLPLNKPYTQLQEEKVYGFFDKYISFEYTNQNWNIVLFVPLSSYLDTYLSIISEFTLNIIIYIVTNIVLAFFIWQSIYKPFDSFVKEITNMNIHNLYSHNAIKLREFNEFFIKFDEMRYQIRRLVSQVEQEAKRNASLETELLISRINPHFIHNTLNNIKLLASQNEQTEISNSISALNNLLYYNLGKSKTTILKEELRAADNYMFLQRQIFNFNYIKEISISSENLELQVPRFILQPILENCFQHSNIKNLTIKLSVVEQNQDIIIAIQDNGKGISGNKLNELKDMLKSNIYSGKGIGLAYVSSSLKLMFGEQANISIDSTAELGTKVVITIHRLDNNACPIKEII